MSYSSFDFPNTHFYDSDLREVLAKLKFLLDEYDKLVNDIADLNEWREQHQGEYEELVRRVETIENEISTFETRITELFAELDRALHEDFEELEAETRQELDETIEEFKVMYEQLRRQIEIDLANMKYEINQLALELRLAIANFRDEMIEYVDERFDLFIQTLPDYEKLIVRNPVTGTQTTVQQALDDLYSAFNVFGLTAKQFDSLGLTAQQFDDYELTAAEFDSMGYKLLGYPDPTYYMLDPFTGEITLVKDVVMKLFGLHAATVTAAFFDALELTCDEFDAKELTAFEFDFNGISA